MINMSADSFCQHHFYNLRKIRVLGGAMKGIKIKFNPKNIYGTEPCCCEKGNDTKFLASTIFCFFCNITKARKALRTNSFCKRYNWAKTCRTCHNHGDYLIYKDKI